MIIEDFFIEREELKYAVITSGDSILYTGSPKNIPDIFRDKQVHLWHYSTVHTVVFNFANLQFSQEERSIMVKLKEHQLCLRNL